MMNDFSKVIYTKNANIKQDKVSEAFHSHFTFLASGRFLIDAAQFGPQHLEELV
jgi:hypothetical protein